MCARRRGLRSRFGRGRGASSASWSRGSGGRHVARGEAPGEDGPAVAVLNRPSGFELDAPGAEVDDSGAAVLPFVRSREELDTLGEPFLRAAREDRLAYPRAGQLGTDLNRDVLTELAGPPGIRPVRQVSLDPVWSALRFRPASG